MPASDEEIKAAARYCVATVLKDVSMHGRMAIEFIAADDDEEGEDISRVWAAIDIQEELFARSGLRPGRRPKRPHITKVYVDDRPGGV